MKASRIAIGLGLLSFNISATCPGTRNIKRKLNERDTEVCEEQIQAREASQLGERAPQEEYDDNAFVHPVLIGDLFPDDGATAVGRMIARAHTLQTLTPAFEGRTSRHNDSARAAARLGFNDAGTWSKDGVKFGGADSRVVLSREEVNRQENNGFRDVIGKMKIW
ncbi:hypothetical protein CC78DRAFT_576486 [Lojkania enalia]|uniref:Uncharacterized protein n=1 Tax=Lojkania enalia TaxID=147567 RepID=A0A9P4KFY4_9PLEO|nr:hypothetical protein CC78DRAFT_576486 [Didymosphaeria enalia]